MKKRNENIDRTKFIVDFWYSLIINNIYLIQGTNMPGNPCRDEFPVSEVDDPASGIHSRSCFTFDGFKWQCNPSVDLGYNPSLFTA